MSYRLSPRAPLPDELRRVLLEELEGAAREVRGIDGSHTSEAIHEARKHLKMGRAVVRLLRPAMGETFYQRENGAMRRAAQLMSPIRDAHVGAQAIRELMKGYRPGSPPAALGRIHREICAELDRVLVASNATRWSKAAGAEIARILRRLSKLGLPGANMQSLCDGLEVSFKKARRARKAAEREPSDENLHELRKRVKDVGYHLRLLGGDRNASVKRLVDRVTKLGETLGAHHDLAMLVRLPPKSVTATPSDRRVLDKVVAPRKAELERDALGLARRALAKKPKAFSKWLVNHWTSDP